MGKKRSTTASAAARRAAGKKLAATPRNLERLDRQIVQLLNQRARWARQLAEQDSDGAAEFSQSDAILKQVAEHNRGPLSESSLRAVYRELLSGIRQLQGPLKVAYLGPRYSYSYLAAVERFGSSAELIPVATIAAVFHELNRGQVHYGLVPIENSTDGRVVDTLDMFARLPVQICGEVQLQIHHHLLGKCPRDQVSEVYSKPQALSQCRDWLATHLSHARTVEMTSTAAAAQLAADKPGAAAIASRQAASNYGLDIIAESIQDQKHNVTRFAVIGGHSAPRTGADKTAMMFEIPHQPGALADAMAVFKRSRLNLTWIESFPMIGTPHEYLFFVELEGHQAEARIRKALASLKRKTVRLEVLGSYAKTEPR